MLESLFRAAVAAAHPAHCLPAALPEPPPRGRLVILAAGKGAGSLTEVAERHYLDAAARTGSTASPSPATAMAGRPGRIAVVEAGHPVPDAAGLAGAERTLGLADGAGGDDLVLVLLSGGASANWIAPAAGLTLAEKQATTRALLRSGANIGEINCVRNISPASRAAVWRERAYPARVVTLAISDVPGDDPAVIGSGPTVPDPTTLADARALVGKYRLELPEAVIKALNDPENESPKPGEPIFANNSYRILARPADALAAAQARARAAGYDCRGAWRPAAG